MNHKIAGWRAINPIKPSNSSIEEYALEKQKSEIRHKELQNTLNNQFISSIKSLYANHTQTLIKESKRHLENNTRFLEALYSKHGHPSTKTPQMVKNGPPLLAMAPRGRGMPPHVAIIPSNPPNNAYKPNKGGFISF